MAVAVNVSDMWLLTGDVWHVTHNTWHLTQDIWYCCIYFFLFLFCSSSFSFCLISVLLYAHIKRFNVSRMLDWSFSFHFQFHTVRPLSYLQAIWILEFLVYFVEQKLLYSLLWACWENICKYSISKGTNDSCESPWHKGPISILKCRFTGKVQVDIYSYSAISFMSVLRERF